MEKINMQRKLTLSFWLINIMIVCSILYATLFKEYLSAELGFFLMIGLILINKMTHITLDSKLFSNNKDNSLSSKASKGVSDNHLSYKAIGNNRDLKYEMKLNEFITMLKNLRFVDELFIYDDSIDEVYRGYINEKQVYKYLENMQIKDMWIGENGLCIKISKTHFK